MLKFVLLFAFVLGLNSCSEITKEKIVYEKFSFKLLKFSFDAPIGYENELRDFGSMVINFNYPESEYLKLFSLSIILKNEFVEKEELENLRNAILEEHLCEMILIKDEPIGKFSNSRKYILLKKVHYNFLKKENKEIYFLLIKDKKSKIVFFFNFFFEDSSSFEFKSQILKRTYKSLKCW